MEPQKKKISAGAIVAIVFAGIIGLAMIGGFIYMIMPSGGSTRSSYSSDKISDSFKNNDGSGRESSGKPVSKQIPLDQFMEINVDVDVFNVIIKPGDKYEVDYECIDGFEPDVSLDGKVLNIKQPNRGINYFGGDYICELYIMVPQNSPLASVRINDNTGHIHIREATIYVDELTTDTGDIIVANVNSQTTKAVSNTGSVVMESVDMGQSVLSTDTGNVDVRASRFGDLDISNNTGKTRIEGAREDLSNYNMNLSTDTGNITVQSQDQGKSYTTSGGSFSLTISSDTGDISIQ